MSVWTVIRKARRFITPSPLERDGLDGAARMRPIGGLVKGNGSEIGRRSGGSHRRIPASGAFGA